jgi:hypothetical protein
MLAPVLPGRAHTRVLAETRPRSLQGVKLFPKALLPGTIYMHTYVFIYAYIYILPMLPGTIYMHTYVFIYVYIYILPTEGTDQSLSPGTIQNKSLNPKANILEPKLSTPNPKPQTPNPKP